MITRCCGERGPDTEAERRKPQREDCRSRPVKTRAGRSEFDTERNGVEPVVRLEIRPSVVALEQGTGLGKNRAQVDAHRPFVHGVRSVQDEIEGSTPRLGVAPAEG